MSDNPEPLLKENEHYELIIDDAHKRSWAVRFLKGNFVETIIMIRAIKINEKDESLEFNFDILNTPDPGYARKDNVKLQEEVGHVIYSIIETGLHEGFVQLSEDPE